MVGMIARNFLLAGGLLRRIWSGAEGGDGAPKGIYGWGGYHTTHFWIDPVNEL